MSPTAGDPRARVTLADVADLADVGRSAVSNWRKRFPDFPRPVAGGTANPVFDLTEVEEWLRRTDRYAGRRAQPGQRLRAAFASLRGALPVEDLVDAASAFITYRAVCHGPNREHNLAQGVLVPAELTWEALLQDAPTDTLQRLQDAVTQLEHLHPRLGGLLAPALRRLPGEATGLLLTIAAAPAATLPDTLEALLAQHRRATGKGGAAWSTSQTLVDLVLDFARPISGTVYDPAAGAAGFLLNAALAAKMPVTVFGQEISDAAWRLGNHRLIVHRLDGEIAHGNTLLDDARSELRADVVLLDPPYALQNWGGERTGPDPRWRFGPPSGNADMAWLQHAIAHLAPGGRAYVLLPAGSLFRGGAEARVRHEIIRQGALDAVIALPAGLQTWTGVSLALWVLNRPGEASRPGCVLLVDTADPADFAASAEQIAETYRGWRREGVVADETRAAALPVLDLLGSDASLVPARWVTPTPTISDGQQALKLIADATKRLTAVAGDVHRWAHIDVDAFTPGNEEPQRISVSRLIRDGHVTLLRGTRIPRDLLGDTRPGIPVVTPTQVRHGLLDRDQQPRVDAELLDRVPDTTHPGDVVVLTEGQGIRATVDNEGGAVLATPVVALRVRPGWMDPRYLAACLESEWNTRYSVGSTIQRANIRDLEVPLLPLEEQRLLADVWERTALVTHAADEIGRLADQIRQRATDSVAAGALRVQRSKAS